MRVDKKYAPVLTGMMMSLFTASFATFLAVAVNRGFTDGFWLAWLKTFAIGYCAITPFVLIVFPQVQKLVARITKN